MLVRFTDADGGLLSLVQSGAPDIRFLDGDGKTWLNYQVERWSTATSPDSAEIWVNVPKVDGNSDHDFITMYYQQDGVTVADGQCATCVFSSTGNSSVADYHLATTVTDATGNYNGTDNATADAAGIIGRGRSFNGSSQYISIARPVQDDFTIGFWMKTAGATSSGAGGNWWGGDALVDGEVPGSANDFGITYNGRVASFGTGNPDATIFTVSPDTVQNGTWKYVTAVRSKTNGTTALYLDGTLKASGTSNTNSLNGPANVYFGQSQGGGHFYNGSLDEIQFSSVVRDSNWIRLTYQTQRNTGNVFWNSRVGPDNIASLTATAGVNNIALSWNTPVSDSTNADSVGIWVKYTGYPDSANAASTTRVVQLPKTDSTYSYPATYPGTYYFALAVRNSNGKWSPFTKASSDTANYSLNVALTDTIYVDSALGSNSNTCVQARSPFTPMRTATYACTCDPNATDTLVIRVMPGKYTDSVFTRTTKPILVTAFDNNSRPVFNGTSSYIYNSSDFHPTLLIGGNTSVKNIDIMAGFNTGTGLMTVVGGTQGNNVIEGCRIYNNGNTKNNIGITFADPTTNNTHVANNLIFQPTTYGILTNCDNAYNISNNVIVGTGVAGTLGIDLNSAPSAADMTITNNIVYNSDYGIVALSAGSYGTLSNNLFYLVTSGREVFGNTDANKIIANPLFADTAWNSKGAYKLLPGSPAIDAGTTAKGSGYVRVSPTDFYGSSRPLGTAPDIGLYEGTGYTPNPANEFDTLTTTSTATTVTVYNSKWKIVFDKAKGGGISEFYDQTAPASNLLASGTVLFDAKVDALIASSQSTIAPTLLEQCASRVVVWQRYGASGSLDVNLYYSIYPSGHIYIQSQLVNLGASTLTVGTVDYTAKVNAATAAYSSLAKDGFAYLTTTTRDVALVATQALDNGSSAGTESWTGTATSGASGNVVFKTTDLLDIVKNFRRNHHFLLYIGDAALTYDKAAALKSDAGNPSPLTVSAGGLIHERSWQDALAGHWTFDEGAGSIVRDKSLANTNNGTITGAKFTSGKVGGALTFASTDVVVVNDDNALEAANSRTFMFWVKPNWATCGSTAFIISKGTSTSDGWYFRRLGASTLEFRVAGTTISTPTLPTGTWSHIVGTIGNSDRVLRLYVNGVLEAASTSASTPTANASNLRFGENTGGGAATSSWGIWTMCASTIPISISPTSNRSITRASPSAMDIIALGRTTTTAWWP